MSGAVHTPGPWEPVSLLRKAGESKAALVVRRVVWKDGIPSTEYLPGSFASLEDARAAIAAATAPQSAANDSIRVIGIGRDAEYAKCLVVYFNEAPSDDDMRRIHKLLRDGGRRIVSAARDDLVRELKHAAQWFDQLTPADAERYRAAIAKAGGAS